MKAGSSGMAREGKRFGHSSERTEAAPRPPAPKSVLNHPARSAIRLATLDTGFGPCRAIGGCRRAARGRGTHGAWHHHSAGDALYAGPGPGRHDDLERAHHEDPHRLPPEQAGGDPGTAPVRVPRPGPDLAAA